MGGCGHVTVPSAHAFHPQGHPPSLIVAPWACPSINFLSIRQTLSPIGPLTAAAFEWRTTKGEPTSLRWSDGAETGTIRASALGHTQGIMATRAGEGAGIPADPAQGSVTVGGGDTFLQCGVPAAVGLLAAGRRGDQAATVITGVTGGGGQHRGCPETEGARGHGSAAGARISTTGATADRRAALAAGGRAMNRHVDLIGAIGSAVAIRVAALGTGRMATAVVTIGSGAPAGGTTQAARGTRVGLEVDPTGEVVAKAGL